MFFEELLECCKVQAIGNVIAPTEEAIYREFCRYYSENFSTPLHQVYELDAEFVILNVFEHQLKDFDSEKNMEVLLDQLYRIENPNFEADQEEELQKYIKQLQEEEKRKKEKQPKQDVVPEDQPKSGGVDFSHLQGEES